ncbi:hypothetical protein KDA_76330 [Dictyobacter alpinus]|uniref:Uncharacterized protein n=1 Tax=Dictyobacter alpinus TaxID=2014873 RepID=A0A402BLE0_9CHLR|nr:hypothetical protein KDA_76330 [Dictyobacter alpinus]
MQLLPVFECRIFEVLGISDRKETSLSFTIALLKNVKRTILVAVVIAAFIVMMSTLLVSHT